MKNLLKLLLLLVLAVYLGLAVTVFNNPEVRQKCAAVDVIVKDSDVAGFITPLEIRTILKDSKLYPVGQKNEQYQLRGNRESACQKSFH